MKVIKEQNKKIKVYFCFPFRGIGGCSLLFLRLAEELQTGGLCDTYLVDYSDGYMSLFRKQNLCNFLEYKDDGKALIPDDAIAVFQSTAPWSIYPGLSFCENTKILYWNCHPFNLIPTFPGLRMQMLRNYFIASLILKSALLYYALRMRKFLMFIHERGAIVFMDKPNLVTTEKYLGVKIINPIFLPIPALDPSAVQPILKDRKINVINIVWLGRIVDFKYFILKHALIELNRIQHLVKVPIVVTIVGTGDYIGKLNKLTSELKNIQFNYVEHISPDFLDDFLLSQNILLGMGTSALEGAKLGVPTILLDPSYKDVSQNYHFKWIYNSIGYSLGSFDTDTHYRSRNDSLFLLLNEVMTDYNNVSCKTISYYNGSHSMKLVSKKFIDTALKSSCTYGELNEKSFMSRGVVYGNFYKLRKLYNSLWRAKKLVK
jgi:hypothetical protein